MCVHQMFFKCQLILKHSESCKGANIFECISTRTERTHQVYIINSSLLSDVLAWSSLVLVGSWSDIA